MDMIFEEVELDWDPRVRGYCKLPYPRHPDGCPMYGKRSECPPEAPPLDEILDLSKPTYVVAITYDIKGHYERLRRDHPDLSEAQIRIPYLWQGRARKILKEAVEVAKREIPNRLVLWTPEANGVNFMTTMLKIGIVLKFPPEGIAYQIAVMGARRAGKLREVFRG